MRKEIEDFYADNNHPIDRVIDIGIVNHGLHKEYQKMALEQVYKQVSKGDLWLARHQIAWKVWDVAREMRSVDRKEAHLEKSDEMKARIPPAEVIDAMKEVPEVEIDVGLGAVTGPEGSWLSEVVLPVASGAAIVALVMFYGGML